MGLEEVVTVSITTVPSPINQVGFGTPLILDSDKNVRIGAGKRTARYNSTADMVAAGWAVTEAAYLAALKIFSQVPSPPQIVVARRPLAPTMRWKVTPVVVDSTKYSGVFNGTAFSFTSGVGTSAALIINGLKTALDALALAITTSNQGPNTSLRILANNAGDWWQFSADDPTLLTVEQDHADPGIATDLAAAILEDNNWYALLCTTASTAEVVAAAAWAEANGPRVYLTGSQDTRIIQNVGTDIETTLNAAAYKRSAVFYHPDNSQFIGAAVAGMWLPKAPGSETVNLKTLSAVSTVPLSGAQKTYASGKFANTYSTLAGRNVLQQGWVANGSFLDQIRARDWFTARVQERLFLLLANAQKIPFTDAGAAQVQSQILAQEKDGVDVGYIAASPKPTCVVPLVSTISPTDKGNRLLPGVTFTYTEAGAIHKVTVNGVVSV